MFVVAFSQRLKGKVVARSMKALVQCDAWQQKLFAIKQINVRGSSKFEFVFRAFSLLEFFFFPLFDIFCCAFVSLVLITLIFNPGCSGVQVRVHFCLYKGRAVVSVVAGCYQYPIKENFSL